MEVDSLDYNARRPLPVAPPDRRRVAAARNKESRRFTTKRKRSHLLSLGAKIGVVASLDHAMWFHAPFNANQWMLYDMEVSGGRLSLILTRDVVPRALQRQPVDALRHGGT